MLVPVFRDDEGRLRIVLIVRTDRGLHGGQLAAPGGKLYSLLPTEISSQGFASQSEEISRGRPLEAEKTRDHFFLTPTEEGANALGGYLSASEETSAQVAALTGQGFRLGALRPGAGVLAVAGQPGANGTSEEGATEIAGIRYGAGRTLVFARADSWRIRTSANVEEENTGGPFNALWQGLVLWTSADAREPSGSWRQPFPRPAGASG